MFRRPPISTRSDTLFPSTTLFRSRWKRSSRTMAVVGWLQAVSGRGDADLRAQKPSGSLGAVPRYTCPECCEAAYRKAARCTCGTRSKRVRSEEHTSELQSIMRISYAVFCLKKKKIKQETARD